VGSRCRYTTVVAEVTDICNDVSRELRDEREQLVEGRRFIRKSRKGRCGTTQRYLQVGDRDCQRQKTKCAVHNNDDNPRKVICFVSSAVFIFAPITRVHKHAKCNFIRSCDVIF
jgi:hypothetical protein